MKSTAFTIMLSVLSSVLTLAVFKATFEKTENNLVYAKDKYPVRFASNINESPKSSPNITNVSDFTDAALKSRPAVVHIQSAGKSDNFLDLERYLILKSPPFEP